MNPLNEAEQLEGERVDIPRHILKNNLIRQYDAAQEHLEWVEQDIRGSGLFSSSELYNLGLEED